MRLLPKSEIQRAKALDTQREIDQGKQLASRVDKLRQVNAEEEAKLAKFRVATLEKLKEDINPLIEHKEQLANEVKTLEERKKQALLPLTTEETRLNEAKAVFAKEKEAWGEKSSFLDQREKAIERAEKELENEKGRIADFKHTTSTNLAESESSLKDAQEKAAEIRNLAQATLSGAEARDKKSLIREQVIANREREVAIQRAFVDTRNMELDKERVFLRDERQTLQRGFDELKRKQHGTR